MRLEVVAFAHRLRLDPDDVVEFWKERAAIREYLGGYSREAAERAAFDRDVHEKFDSTFTFEIMKEMIARPPPTPRYYIPAPMYEAMRARARGLARSRFMRRWFRAVIR